MSAVFNPQNKIPLIGALVTTSQPQTISHVSDGKARVGQAQMGNGVQRILGEH
jgi:hypothetical protein